MFQKPVPGFNIAGKTGVGTLLGSLCSLFLIIIMTLYGLIKFDHLISKHNPTITTLEEQHEFGEDLVPVNLRDDANMRFAFSVLTTSKSESLLDPRYVKIITRIRTKFANGTETE